MARDAVEIKFNPEQIQAVKAALAGIRDGFVRVAQGAISKTLTYLKTRTVHALADDARIKQKSLRRDIYIKRPTFQVLAGFIRFGGSKKGKARVPIYEMYARQTRKGVTFQGRGGRQQIPHAFIATMKSGHVGVFKRTGPITRTKYVPYHQAPADLGPKPKGMDVAVWATIRRTSPLRPAATGGFEKKQRQKIIELFGPSFWWLWETHAETQERVHADAEDLLKREMENRLAYVVGKYRGEVWRVK
jgi:hypothetical protein